MSYPEDDTFLAPWRALMQFLNSISALFFGPFPKSLMAHTENAAAGPGAGRSIRLLCALGVAGVAIRLSLLAIPPVIPLVHADLRMSEAQVGFLIGLPLAVFAVTSILGSLLIARIGSTLAVILGITIAALGGGGRGAAGNVWTLYAAVAVMGFGIAITQPALPALVREWMPKRIALGTVVYSSGMVIGATLGSALTIPYVLPLVGGNWRLDLGFWGLVALLIVPAFYLLGPHGFDRHAESAIGGRWWPDFGGRVVWLLGLTFGGNNAAYYTANAFLGDYLTSQGQADQLGPAFAWLNGAQIASLAILLVASGRMQGRLWPFAIFGPLLLAAFLGFIFMPTPLVIRACAAFIGISCSVTMTATLALPPFLSEPRDVPRMAAGMFTISYAGAIMVPTISGALWDATGLPWVGFLPSCICAVVLTVFGLAAAAHRPVNSPKA